MNGLLLLFVYLTFLGGTVYSDLNLGLRVFHQLLMTGLLGGWLIGLLRRRELLPRTGLEIPLAFFIGVRILSGLLGQDPRMSLEFFWRPLIHVALFFWLVWLMRRQGWSKLFKALYLTAGVVCIVGLIEWIGWYVGLPFLPIFQEGWLQIGGLANPIPPVNWRLSFTLTNSTALSAYLAVLIPPAVAMALLARKKDSRIAWVSFVVVALVVQLLSQSRGGLLALAVSLPLLALVAAIIYRDVWAAGWRALRAKRWFWPAVAVLGLIVAAAFVLLVPNYLGRMASVQVRVELWRCALAMLKENPLTGVGNGLYGRALRSCVMTPTAEYERFTTAHNLYLNIAAESGVGAVVGLVWLALSFLFLVRKRWLGADSKGERLRLSAMIAALAGYAANSVVDTFLDTPVVLPVLLLGAYLVYPLNYKVAVRRKPRGGRLLMLAALGSYLLGFVWIDWGQWHFEKSLQASNQGDWLTALAEVDRAHEIDPLLGLYPFQRASIEGMLAAEQPGLYTAPALDDLVQAIETENTLSLHNANLALLQAQAGYLDTALETWERTVTLNPPDSRYYINMGVVAEEAGQDEEAIRAYAEGLARRPRSADSLFWVDTPFRQDNWEEIVALAMEQTAQPAALCLAIGDLACAERETANPQSGSDFLQLGWLRMAQNDWEAASAAFDMAIELMPQSAGAYAARAETALAMGDKAAAEYNARVALFVDPYGGARAHYVLGQLASSDGDRPGAIEQYWQAVSPQFVSQNWEVVLYNRRAMFTLFPQVIDIGNGNREIEPWLELAKLFEQDGEIELAKQVYTRVLDRNNYVLEAREGFKNLGMESE